MAQDSDERNELALTITVLWTPFALIFAQPKRPRRRPSLPTSKPIEPCKNKIANRFFEKEIGVPYVVLEPYDGGTALRRYRYEVHVRVKRFTCRLAPTCTVHVY